MSLSPKQNRIYRRLVDAAWKKTCERDLLLNVFDKIAEKKWYRAELMASPLHIYSTTQMSPTGEFAKLMAHFEAIVGDSCEWNIKSEIPEDRRRIIYWIEGALITIGQGWQYAEDIADQMNKGYIDTLKTGELKKILFSLDQHARRTNPSWKTNLRHGEPAADRKAA